MLRRSAEISTLAAGSPAPEAATRIDMTGRREMEHSPSSMCHTKPSRATRLRVDVCCSTWRRLIVRRRNLFLTFVVMLATLVIGTGAQGIAAAAPRTIYVAHKKKKDKSDECAKAHHKTIQSALDAAKPGGTVFVCPGTYVEGDGHHGKNALTITKDVNLVGAGADKVVVEPKKKS